MANPMRWFRRHQKIMMVFFGVGLMAVFGLGSVVSMINPSDLTGGRKDPTIASWKGGNLTRSDLDTLRLRHFQMMRFLGGLQNYAADKKGDNFQSMAIPIQPVVRGGDFRPEQVDEQLLSRFLLAQRAEEDGMIVGDGMIDDYLALVAGNVPVSNMEFIAINKEVNQNRVGFESVKRQLKMELAAQQMSNFTMAAIPMVPNPLDAIELYTKTSRRVECQALPIQVDPAAVTEEPSASDLRKIYDTGKYKYADPRGIVPGFKIGKKVKVQYFIANTDTFLQNEINKLTDAEVQAEYERLVAEENPIVMELVPDDDQPEINNPDEAAQDDAAPKQSDEEAADGDAKSDPAPLVPENADQEQSDEESDEKQTKEEPGGGDDDGSSAPASEVPEESDDDGVSLIISNAQSKYVSTSLQQEESEEKQNTEPGSLEEMLQTPEIDEPALPRLGNSSEKADKAPKAPAAPKRRPKALIDCAQAVKESLKREDANLAIDDALNRSEAELGTYRMIFTRWKFGDESTRGEEPEPIDLKTIADNYNLEFSETELVDGRELGETVIGKVRVLQRVMGPNGRPQVTFPPLAQVIFDQFHDANEYDSKRENDMASGSAYVFWLKEKAESRVPELDEVKDEVVAFWKKRRAVDKAMAEAAKIADSINANLGETLVARFPEKAIQTGEFTWFNTRTNQPVISSPVGITNAGDEFMKTVFSLNQYEAGAAANYSADTVYVLQMMTEKASYAETGMDYLENRFFKFKTIPNDVRSVSQWYGQEINIDWNQEFTKSMDFEMIGQ